MSDPPQTVAYCHCSDCRRWTGAPVAAFAAFDRSSLTAIPALGAPTVHTAGVERWNCAACGSPLAARFDYLPRQVYVPLGLLDQIATIAPQIHCHAESAPPWLHIADDLPRETGSARDSLNDAAQ
ncbi:MAG: GFA family protein [Pseudomonadota bacterium]